MDQRQKQNVDQITGKKSIFPRKSNKYSNAEDIIKISQAQDETGKLLSMHGRDDDQSNIKASSVKSDDPKSSLNHVESNLRPSSSKNIPITPSRRRIVVAKRTEFESSNDQITGGRNESPRLKDSYGNQPRQHRTAQRPIQAQPNDHPKGQSQEFADFEQSRAKLLQSASVDSLGMYEDDRGSSMEAVHASIGSHEEAFDFSRTDQADSRMGFTLYGDEPKNIMKKSQSQTALDSLSNQNIATSDKDSTSTAREGVLAVQQASSGPRSRRPRPRPINLGSIGKLSQPVHTSGKELPGGLTAEFLSSLSSSSQDSRASDTRPKRSHTLPDPPLSDVSMKELGNSMSSVYLSAQETTSMNSLSSSSSASNLSSHAIAQASSSVKPSTSNHESNHANKKSPPFKKPFSRNESSGLAISIPPQTRSNPLSSPASTSVKPQQQQKSPPNEASQPSMKRVKSQRLELKDDDLVVLNELGLGSGGTVYRVRHTQTGQIMAKKIIHHMDIEIGDEIMRELKILDQCNHGNIISFYGAYRSDGDVCICMEYMDVGSLEKISKVHGLLPEWVLVKVAVGVLEGLVYLWEELRILHRDIKPSNILLNSIGQIKLCDFGVSGLVMDDRAFANTFVGTGAYMSPERIQGSKYSTQCDTWGLGMSLLELALGRYPFSSGGASTLVEANDDSDDHHSQNMAEDPAAPMTVFEIFSHVINDPIPMPSSSKYSLGFQELIKTMLERDPNKRPSPKALLSSQQMKQISSASENSGEFGIWCQRFLDKNLNRTQMKRWSVSQQQKKRQSMRLAAAASGAGSRLQQQI